VTAFTGIRKVEASGALREHFGLDQKKGRWDAKRVNARQIQTKKRKANHRVIRKNPTTPAYLVALNRKAESLRRGGTAKKKRGKNFPRPLNKAIPVAGESVF